MLNDMSELLREQGNAISLGMNFKMGLRKNT